MSRAISALTLSLLAGLFCVGAARGAEPQKEPTPSGWFHIYSIDRQTYAISEPKYWQENVSYLLIGTRSALLFDTGPGIYSIRTEVKRLTSLPVIVIPSHLHYDHVGDIGEFTDVRLLDDPALRAQVHNGYFEETSAQYSLKGSIKYRVHGWIKDGETIDLGGRSVRLISTPGHTPDSVSVVYQEGARMFTGDLVNRLVSLYSVPGADVAAAARSLQHLMKMAHPETLVYEAHAEKPFAWSELRQLTSGVSDIAAGRVSTSTSVCLGSSPMQQFAVGPFVVMLPDPTGGIDSPAESVTDSVDFAGHPCD
jgi:glyoxylase-like metal-dependent hydrolase (beta-lactamase superfamily II)